MKSGNSGSATGEFTVADPRNSPAATDERLRTDPWDWWRQQMPIAAEWAYFDHAAVAPIPQPAAAAIEKFASDASLLGDTVWPSWAKRLDLLREKFRELLNADSSEICLIPNTTTGINLVAEGWPWQPGDSVVIPDGEFPSNLFPWLNQEPRGVETRIVPRREGGEVLVEDLLAHADDSTKMIAVSWVGYASGYRINVSELVDRAHQQGILVFLDAIQGLGVYPLDLKETPVDFLAADGHKWLLGPEGLGAAMIAKRHVETLRCGNVGWNSVKNSHNYAKPELDLRSTAVRFEPGSANMVGAAALNESVELFLEVRRAHGPDAIANRVIGLAEELDRELSRLGAITRLPTDRAARSGILTFEIPDVEPAVVRRRGLEEKVVLSVRDGGVRASIHAYNDERDLARLVEVVRSFL